MGEIHPVEDEEEKEDIHSQFSFLKAPKHQTTTHSQFGTKSYA